MPKIRSILLTGASGHLGFEIKKINKKYKLLTPSHQQLDITKKQSVTNFFKTNHIDAIIHCAALARMAICEEDPVKAININIIGTSNLVIASIDKSNRNDRNIRFLQISTDGVYAGIKGKYSEKDPAIPYNKYGWTKLASECVVSLLKDHCIVRTSFFDPSNIRFQTSAIDKYSSRLPISDLAKAILDLVDSKFVGTLNVGGPRESDYKRDKKFKPDIMPCTRKDLLKNVNFGIAKDSSLNVNLWKKIRRESKKIS